MSAELAQLRSALRAWYGSRRRAFPWRRRRDPYRVLVSEVMLQQTQAARVAGHFEAFVARFPTLADLAGASRADVVRAWDGLGYNRRAVALSEAARAIVVRHGGHVPADPAALERLPGVGAYTAAAVAAIAHGAPVAAVDVNVRRVAARVLLGDDEAPAEDVRTAAERWLDRDDPASWNEAVMDLGREICRPVPRCDACPLAPACRFLRSGAVPGRPRRRQAPFAGSTRELRGRIVRSLRRRSPSTLGSLAVDAGVPDARVASIVAVLAADGLVEAGPAALQGRPRGLVRLAG